MAAVTFGSFAGAQTRKPADPRFAIPGSPDSASAGQKTPDLGAAKKAKRRGARGESHPRPGAPVATFPGFRLLPDGASRIYVELSKNVTVEERRSKGALVYTLRGAQVLVRNNKNALITTHFATPVSRARLISSANDVDLVIDLRKAVDATHQVVAGDNGTVRLEIDFPAGDYPLAPGLFEPAQGMRGRSGASRSDTDEELPPDVPPTPPANSLIQRH